MSPRRVYSPNHSLTNLILMLDVNLYMPLVQSCTSNFFKALKSFWFVSDQDHITFDFILSFRLSIDFLVSGPRQNVAWFTRPRMPLISLRLFGVGYFSIVSIWFFVGNTPC